MEIKDIVALAHAGFTADQIAKLAAVPSAPAAPAPEAPAAPAPAPAPAQVPGATIPQTPAPDPMAALFAKIDALGSQVQAAALNATEQPKTETVDDILASIINPPMPAANNKEG